MIIVAGHIRVHKGKAGALIDASRQAMKAAREAKGCRDFTVAADPIEPDRVYVYECWDSAKAMLAFRGDGPGGDLSSLIEIADVKRYSIRSTRPA